MLFMHCSKDASPTDNDDDGNDDVVGNGMSKVSTLEKINLSRWTLYRLNQLLEPAE